MASWSDRFAQVTQNAISKSKEVAGVTKLNMEIGALNQDIRNIQTLVGAYVLENGLLLENPYIAEWAEKVNAHKAEIGAKNEKIMELKNIVVCTGCGREVSRNSRFCEHCGAEIIVKASAADEAKAPKAESMEEAAEVVVSAESGAADDAVITVETAAESVSTVIWTATAEPVSVTVEAAPEGAGTAGDAASDGVDGTV